MQNGHSSHVEAHVDADSESLSLHTSHINGSAVDGASTNNTHQTVKSEDHSNRCQEAPAQQFSSPVRGRKRKLSEVQLGKSRRQSPPWKAFAADGPTSFKSEDGRRKSGRMNAIPLELHSHGNKRQTRGGYAKYQDDRSGGANTSPDQNGQAYKRPSKGKPVTKRVVAASTTSPVKSASSKSPLKRAQPNVQNNVTSEPQPKRQSLRGRDAVNPRQLRAQRSSLGEPHHSSRLLPHNMSSDIQRRGLTGEAPENPRIMLRLGPRSLPIMSPGNISLAKRQGSLGNWLAEDDPLEGEGIQRYTEQEAAEEAKARLRVIESSRLGGVLDDAFDSNITEEPPPEEPFAGFTNIDHLVLHAQDLLQRMQHEAREHRATAKRLAQAAAAAARVKMPKTVEEIEAEARDRTQDRMKAVLKQLKSHLDLATQKIMQLKKQDFLDREAAAGREQMRELVDRSEGLLTARTAQHIPALEDENTSDSVGGSQSDGSDQSDTEDVSRRPDDDSDDDDSESTSEAEDENPDENLTLDQLRAKYSTVPKPFESETEDTTPQFVSSADSTASSQRRSSPRRVLEEHDTGRDEHAPALEDVDAVMLDDEDKESDTSGTSTEDDAEEQDEDASEDDSKAASESEDDDGRNLLGFFSKKEVDLIRVKDMQTQEAFAEDPHRSAHSPRGARAQDPRTTSETPEQQSISGTTLEAPQNVAADDMSNIRSEMDDVQPSAEVEDVSESIQRPEVASLLDYAHQDSSPTLEVPPLIRGHLRPYQHAGFEWLAGMYTNETNGILADEMGLGKTFQTIALLAYLATRHHVWGPHLVVVPTSVILNWEIEFKKFLPGFKVLSYYGSQDERREKRKGWSDSDKWNVVITSYQLALSDQVVLKRRPWHYLVLDEAHNIKNHKSQRWQTLLSFRSQARLLLTGTPLQNNLAELWSLLFFLAPEQDERGRTSFGDLTEFSKMFHRPVDQILDNGRNALDKEGMDIVAKLHQVLRPHLLRRLKIDVETQMPKKYEHVTVCRLSKRQRHLYDGYMGLAGTRESFASGNYMSIISCLMQLRKVCNHPDLFETRQIVTSFAMPKSAIADYEIRELLVRRKLLQDARTSNNPEFCSLWKPNNTSFAASRSRSLTAEPMFASILDQRQAVADDKTESLDSLPDALAHTADKIKQFQLQAVSTCQYASSRRSDSKPIYSHGLLQKLQFVNQLCSSPDPEQRGKRSSNCFLERSSVLDDAVLDLERRNSQIEPLVERFCCTTPNVTAPGIARLALTDIGAELVERSTQRSVRDPFHEARVRLSIAFPDKSLIQYDCGKLQQLGQLLRELQVGGHRAVIFTQMTKVLDILEQFMNLHGHRYLRLDGSTKIEQRQIITERFNTDTRILAFISSSRSGGLGINLTGADTVIFYDLDWNPAMDKQCQDRCHRIGQTRDVHIYRFVSEGTIEANILRKSNQKRMLDDVVIQEGEFTTEYFNRLGADDEGGETDAAIDKVFGGSSTRMLQQAEDKEDQEAATEAQKEELQADDGDFGEKTTDGPESTDSPKPAASADKVTMPRDKPSLDSIDQPLVTDRTQRNPRNLDPATREQLLDGFASKALPQDKPTFRDVDEDGEPCPGTWDEYVMRLVEWEMQDVVWRPPRSAKDKKKKKGSEFGIIRR